MRLLNRLLFSLFVLCVTLGCFEKKDEEKEKQPPTSVLRPDQKSPSFSGISAQDYKDDSSGMVVDFELLELRNGPQKPVFKKWVTRWNPPSRLTEAYLSAPDHLPYIVVRLSDEDTAYSDLKLNYAIVESQLECSSVRMDGVSEQLENFQSNERVILLSTKSFGDQILSFAGRRDFTLCLKVTDRGGNQSVASYEFGVENLKPQVKQTIEYQMSDVAQKASSLPPFLGEKQRETAQALQNGESAIPPYLFSESVILLDNPYPHPLYVEFSFTGEVNFTIYKWNKGWKDDLFNQILASEQRWEQGRVDSQVFWWKGGNDFLSPKKVNLPSRGVVYLLPPKDSNTSQGRSSFLILLTSDFRFETAYAKNILYNSLSPNLISDVFDIRGNLTLLSAPEGVSPRYYEDLSNWQQETIRIRQPLITVAE